MGKRNLEVPRGQEKDNIDVTANGSLLWLIEMLRIWGMEIFFNVIL